MSRLPEKGALGLPKDLTRTVEPVCECHSCKQESGGGKPELCCTFCHLAFCSKHTVPHLLAYPDHVLQLLSKEVGARPTASETSTSTLRHCQKHDLPLRYYCEKCNTTVCGDCTALGDHHMHNPIVPVNDIVKELHHRVRRKTDKIKTSCLSLVKMSLRTVENVSTVLSSGAEKVRLEIRSAGKRATDAVELLVQKKLMEVDHLEEIRLKDLNSQHEELKRLEDSLTNVVSFGKKNLETPEAEAEEVCELLLAIERRADELGQTRVAEELVQHARVDFESVSEEDLLVKASELVGVVLPCQASAKHSVVEGESEKSCCVDSAASFMIAAKDYNGRALSKGGDMVRVKCVEFPEGAREQPTVEVIDKNNGTYEISCTAHHVGFYAFQVFINKVQLEQWLEINCHHSCITFDRSECQQDTTISADQLTMINTGGGCRWSSVLSSCGIQSGQHSWKVRVSKASQNMNLFIGVAEKPGLTAKANNYTSTYSWYGSDGQKWMMNKQSQGVRPWKVNDILQLELDCDAHTLTIKNTRSGEKDSITNLPDKQLFAYFSTAEKDLCITLQL